MTITRTTTTRISANHWETHEFAYNNPAGKWPCSALAGKTVWLELAPNGDLIDGNVPEDCLSEELAAFIDYMLAREES